METLAACAISGAICFVLGVVFQKSVIADVSAVKVEAQLLRDHVSAELAKLRDGIVADLKKL